MIKLSGGEDFSHQQYHDDIPRPKRKPTVDSSIMFRQHDQSLKASWGMSQPWHHNF